MIEIVCLLSLLTLGQQFAAAGAADRTLLQAIGDLLVVCEYAGLVGVFAFCSRAPVCTTPCSSDHGSFPDGFQAGGSRSS